MLKAIVTGSTKGIGKAIALKFLNCGHEVIGIDVLQSSIDHPHYTHVVCDVRGILPDVKDANVIVTSAGVQLPDEDTIDVNLKGTINVVEKYAFQPCVKSVLTIASASGRNGAEFPMYSASKGGVIAYTKNVALRLAKFGATANSLSPGGVKTSINNDIMNDETLWKAVLGETLLGKWADAEEIADWAYFLTVVNKSMTGEDLLVDNGEMVKSNFIWQDTSCL